MSTSPLLSLLWLLGTACAMQASGGDLLPKVSKQLCKPIHADEPSLSHAKWRLEEAQPVPPVVLGLLCLGGAVSGVSGRLNCLDVPRCLKAGFASWTVSDCRSEEAVILSETYANAHTDGTVLYFPISP